MIAVSTWKFYWKQRDIQFVIFVPRLNQEWDHGYQWQKSVFSSGWLSSHSETGWGIIQKGLRAAATLWMTSRNDPGLAVVMPGLAFAVHEGEKSWYKKVVTDNFGCSQGVASEHGPAYLIWHRFYSPGWVPNACASSHLWTDDLSRVRETTAEELEVKQGHF